MTAAPMNSDRREFFLGQDLRATVLTTSAETDGRHDLTYGVKAPGATTPLHVHTRYEERFWVVAGSMTVWAGNEEETLSPGDYYLIPTGIPHAIQAGSEGASALIISSPAGFAELVARTGTPAHKATPETVLDNELFVAVTTEMGDVILGPPGATPEDFTPNERA